METVKLNVSGQLTEVAKSTLVLSPYFENLLNGKFKQPADGIYFIDCDPEAFRAILRYLRHGVEIESKYEPEANYFMIAKTYDIDLGIILECKIMIEKELDRLYIAYYDLFIIFHNGICQCLRDTYYQRRNNIKALYPLKNIEKCIVKMTQNTYTERNLDELICVNLSMNKINLTAVKFFNLNIDITNTENYNDIFKNMKEMLNELKSAQPREKYFHPNM